MQFTRIDSSTACADTSAWQLHSGWAPRREEEEEALVGPYCSAQRVPTSPPTNNNHMQRATGESWDRYGRALLACVFVTPEQCRLPCIPRKHELLHGPASCDPERCEPNGPVGGTSALLSCPCLA